MARPVVCLMLHGIGTYFADAEDSVFNKDDFDFDLYDALRSSIDFQTLPRIHTDPLTERLAGKVIWQPVLWAQRQLERRQLKIEKGRHRGPGWGRAFSLMVSGMGDAAAYQFRERENGFYKGTVYSDIQNTLFRFLERIEKGLIAEGIDPMTVPVVVFAHSMGCHVLSSYAWDAQCRPERVNRSGNVSAFCRLETLASVVFAGCNIPLLNMGVPDNRKIPLRVAKGDWGGEQIWESFYDPDDLLGYAIENEYKAWFAGLHPHADKFLSDEALNGFKRDPATEIRPVDRKIELGEGFSSAFRRVMATTPMSHEYYWFDKRVIDTARTAIQNLMD